MAGPDVPMVGLDLDETLFEVNADSMRGLEITGHMKSGEDSLNVKGGVTLDDSRGWPAHVELSGSNFMVINIPDAMFLISPDLKVDYSGESGIKVRGELTVPEAEITPREIPAGVEEPSGDVVVVSHENPEGDKSGLPVDADVSLNLLDMVHFKGFGLDCFVTGRMTVEMLPDKDPAAHGELRIKEGTFRFYGHDLTIDKGVISYAGGRLDNPGINLLAVRDVGGIPVGVRVTGYVSDLDVSGYSTDPSISSQDAITMLITGKSKHDPGFSEAAANTAAIAGADMVAQQLKGYTGLDHLDVTGSGENSSDTRVFAGKDVTEDLTVGVEAGTDDDGTQFVAKYHLWRDLDLEIKSGAARSGMSLLYTIEFK
jgi:translocation and assembly module TamB